MYQKHSKSPTQEHPYVPKTIRNFQHHNSTICTKKISRNYTPFPTQQLIHVYQKHLRKVYTEYVTQQLIHTYQKKFPKLYTNLQHNNTCPYVPKICNTNIPPYVPRIIHRFATQQYIHIYQRLYNKFSTQQLIHIYEKLYTISTQLAYMY
jgi:hypothetical protein